MLLWLPLERARLTAMQCQSWKVFSYRNKRKFATSAVLGSNVAYKVWTRLLAHNLLNGFLSQRPLVDFPGGNPRQCITREAVVLGDLELREPGHEET